MSRRNRERKNEFPASFKPRDNDPEPEPDPEPPIAPPVIILSKNSPAPIQEPITRLDPAYQPQPHSPTSPPPLLRINENEPRSGERYNFRPTTRRHPDPEPAPDPAPAPEPDPAPPIIILPHKRPASSSPPRSNTPTASTASTSPIINHKQLNDMGSKASKVSGGKLQPSTAKSDKAEMKEPSNYYSHRSKSMRRKAGRGAGSDGAQGGASQGSGGGLA